MYPLLNQLMQLQELVLIREEKRVAGHADHQERLDASISGMIKQLPADVKRKFEKLRNRDQNIVVPVGEDGCSVCSMKLPRSLLQAIRTSRELNSCPNCARILFMLDEAPRNMHRRQSRFDRPKPGIARFSAESLMLPSLEGNDQDAVIVELAQAMQDAGFVDRADLLADEAMRREAMYSTAVDHGLAFPHARGVEGGGLALALGLHREGICFDGKDDEPSHIIFFLAIPTVASAFYLKLLAGLTETFMEAEARETLLAAEDAKSLWKTLAKVTRKTIK